jgi:5-formyltetrahydrofolate cyclo-ligase
LTASAVPPNRVSKVGVMDDPALAAAKRAARVAAKAARAAAATGHSPEQAGEALAARFPNHLAPSIVSGYWPMGSEIDPRPLMRLLSTNGARLALPRMETKEGPPVFRAFAFGDALVPDVFKIPAPAATVSIVEPDLVLVPLLAFDRAGNRLGYGRGHYDRALAQLPRAIAVGLAYAAQEDLYLPSGAFDRRLDWIITEREAINASNGP